MSELLARGRGTAKAGSPVISSKVGSVSSPREDSPNPMYGEQPWLEDQEEMKDKFIAVGVCAMDTKTMARPMQNILERLQVQNYIKIVMFTEKTILEEPIDNWPICDCLIAFYSHGFPLNKAIDYVKLRKPLVFNDLEMQFPLMDRREVYKILNANGVETPPYEVCDRDKDEPGGADVVLHELDDVLEINGRIFHKPFVEKPISAEDHNIYIYFPSDFGGGSQRLFRKVKNRSSSYSKESSVRNTGSYIYEEFLATDGTDVKVYTVGPDYAHAEARKSPALDGKVERDRAGKEVRYPVILTAKEKLIARAVCMAFKQTVCGFDLLRANGRSYVCDVNGFSFVKNSQKYYDDCAQILLEMITAYLGPHFIPPIPPSVEYLMDEIPEMPVPIPKADNNIELRCVVGVIRHGDRTPKQKMKMIVTHKKFFDLFQELKGYETGHLKIKKPKLLQMVLDIARDLLAENEVEHGSEIQEKIHKLEQLRTVLEMYGTFSGINRKVQFKLLSKKTASGEPQLLLILKWGGEHTQSGQLQAEELGRAFRIIYPGGEGEYASLPGSGFLRLHSTYRHDLKVYASDEGRVQMTAAAFTKGLLDLEGNPASVLVHLVKRDQAANNMLDTSTNAQEAMNCVKERLHGLMRSPHDFTEQSFQELAPTRAKPIVAAMKKVQNPRATCDKLYGLIKSLLRQLREMMANMDRFTLYHGETLQLMVNRWGKLEKDFKLKNGQFDISKIPDIYDCIKYDLLHNSHHLDLKVGKEVLRCVMPLADIVVPQEYGITREEKLDIARKICTPLLRKIQADFHHTIVNEQADILHRLDHRISKGVISPKRHVRTRLYFTSESHVHSLTNLLKYDNLLQTSHKNINIHNIPELNYITQIVFLLFEDLCQPEDSDLRYLIQIHFSPGVRCRDELAVPGGIHTPDLGVPSQFIKRLPVVPSDGQHNGLARRHSDFPSHGPTQLEVSDAWKHKVVWRMSEHTAPTGKTCDERFKSLSETEMVRRKSGSNESSPTDVTRSKSMGTLNLGSSSPPPKSQTFDSWSPTKLLVNGSPLQPKKGVMATRKISAPSKCNNVAGCDRVCDEQSTPSKCGSNHATGDVVDIEGAQIIQDFLIKPGCGVTPSRNFSAPEFQRPSKDLGSNDLLRSHSSALMKRGAKQYNYPDISFGVSPSLVSFQIEEKEEERGDLSSGQSTPIHNDRVSVAGSDKIISGQSTSVHNDRLSVASTDEMSSGQSTPVMENIGKDVTEQSGKESELNRRGQVGRCWQDSVQPSDVYSDIGRIALQPVTITRCEDVTGTDGHAQTGPIIGVGKTQSDPSGLLASRNLAQSARKLSAPVNCGMSMGKPHLKKNSEDLSSSGVSSPVKNQGSNEQLNRQADNLAAISTSVMGERGLVLSTELSSLIHPLSSIGEASLSWVNEYLTSITGVHLNYEVPEVVEDPPNFYRRFSSQARTPPAPSTSSELEGKFEDHRDSMVLMQGSLECERCPSAPPLKGHWSSGGKPDSPPEEPVWLGGITTDSMDVMDQHTINHLL